MKSQCLLQSRHKKVSICIHFYICYNVYFFPFPLTATPSTSPPQASSISTTPTVDLTTESPLPTSHTTTTTTTLIQATTKSNGPSTSSTTQSTTHKSTASLTTSDNSFWIQTTPVTKPIDVECGTGFISVIVNRGFLNNSYIPVSALYLGQSECVPNQVNSTHVHLVAAWHKCGTTLTQVSVPGCQNITTICSTK